MGVLPCHSQFSYPPSKGWGIANVRESLSSSLTRTH